MTIKIEISAQKQTLRAEGKTLFANGFQASEQTSRIRPESIRDNFVEADPGCTGFHQLLMLAGELTPRR